MLDTCSESIMTLLTEPEQVGSAVRDTERKSCTPISATLERIRVYANPLKTYDERQLTETPVPARIETKAVI